MLIFYLVSNTPICVHTFHRVECNNFTAECCIRPTSPYLIAALKPDNLPEICNNISEKVLRRKLQA